MMQVISTIRGALASLVLGLNTILHVPLMIPPVLFKRLARGEGAKRRADTMLNAIASSWIACNGLWMPKVLSPASHLEVLDELDPRRWYVVLSNHRGWADIFVLQSVLTGRIPLLKFFLKQELIYVPLAGFAWWALDFPFVKRGGNPRTARRDLDAARASCERFRALPTSVLNFVEGTRYTPAKAEEQSSPYRHLLKPKVAGLTAAFAALEGKLEPALDVTLVYPGGTPTFWALLTGRVGRVVVHARKVPLPQAAPGADERTLRKAVDAWLTGVWTEKDALIDRVLAATGPRRPATPAHSA